ncbi:lasso peptide biosynthesis PqqD family chaperone [Amphibacillus jilinensis]|uniref:lasso peptide biosynthesis PqqD family chaperone n=1 Tax=Amphibacillus jilinensis TaxID=1216008 RepID=UPI00030D5C95|nr:lasso peptide biosynthesis PqqD family chaperone [Amphibacillus jilinensis]
MKRIEGVDKNQMIKQLEGNIVSDMDGEKVMLSVTKGKYFNLGELGGEIWDMIIEPISIQQLVLNLLEQYDVDQEVCYQQVIAFIRQLAEAELIHIYD